MAVCNRIWIHRRRNKWLSLFGILAILLGVLWLQQGLGLAAAAAALKGTAVTHAETAIATPDWTFESIYGGNYGSADFAGKVVLLVNTASLCGYTPQYSALQKLQDTNKDQGLVVFAMPSDDLSTAAAFRARKQRRPDNYENGC